MKIKRWTVFYDHAITEITDKRDTKTALQAAVMITQFPDNHLYDIILLS